MKNILKLYILVLAIFMVGCSVDDYQDANPPVKMDGPQFTFALGAEEIVGGQSTSFTINVIDAPGGISDSIVFVTKDDLGDFVFSNLESLIGKESGEITGTFTAPTSFEGDFEIAVTVYDLQLDDEGEIDPKGLSEEAEIKITFPGGAPDFTVTLGSSSIVRGTATTLDIALDVPDGFESILITTTAGSVEIDEASVTAAVGQSVGTIKATFTADPITTGEVTLTISVTDQLQKRTSTKDQAITIAFAFDAPSIDLSFDASEMNFFEKANMTAVITSPGVVETITIAAYTRESYLAFDPDDENSELVSIGDITLGDGEVAAVVGTTGGTVTGTFSTPDLDYGYVIFSVTVLDVEGRETEKVSEVLVKKVALCEYATTYTSKTTAGAKGGGAGVTPTVLTADELALMEVSITATQVGEFILEFDDMSFGLYPEIYEDGNLPKGRVVFTGCGAGETIVDMGDTDRFDDPFTMSGTLDADGKITLTWSNTWGDSGTVELSPGS